VTRFVNHQVVELARDCLAKSQEKMITSHYFYEMTEALEQLLVETQTKSPEALSRISMIVRKLLLIISRPARLLECLEFNPEEYYRMLEEADREARLVTGIKDVPSYIISKLNLGQRDPLEELQDGLRTLSTNSSTSTEASDDCKGFRPIQQPT
ncbi:unnamed protein product, partial [Cyprideis torosa]